jgi:hypothetical protein
MKLKNHGSLKAIVLDGNVKFGCGSTKEFETGERVLHFLTNFHSKKMNL